MCCMETDTNLMNSIAMHGVDTYINIYKLSVAEGYC